MHSYSQMVRLCLCGRAHTLHVKAPMFKIWHLQVWSDVSRPLSENLEGHLLVSVYSIELEIAWLGIR